MSAVGALLSPAQPAHAHDVCRVEGFVPEHDHLTMRITAHGIVSCSRVQHTIVFEVTAQKQVVDTWGDLVWADRGTSSRAFHQASGGFWRTYSSCAQSDAAWRSKAFTTALEQAGDTSFFRNDQHTAYSGSRWADCYEEIPVIDPGSR